MSNSAAYQARLDTIAASGLAIVKAQPDMRFAFETSAEGVLRVAGDHRPVATLMLSKLAADHHIHSPRAMQEAFVAITTAVAETGRPVATESNGLRSYAVIQPTSLF